MQFLSIVYVSFNFVLIVCIVFTGKYIYYIQIRIYVQYLLTLVTVPCYLHSVSNRVETFLTHSYQFGKSQCLLCTRMNVCLQLPKFYFLCEDSIWGVRKACAECFAQVSTVCTPAIRRAELSQLFINLIYDQSRWVCRILVQCSCVCISVCPQLHV